MYWYFKRIKLFGSHTCELSEKLKNFFTGRKIKKNKYVCLPWTCFINLPRGNDTENSIGSDLSDFHYKSRFS